MKLNDYLANHKQEQLSELLELLRIPSISTDSEHVTDVRQAAEFLADKLKDAGLEAQVMDTSRHPVVYAERLSAEGAPTVLVYGHYDVQPPDPLELWHSPPFEPVAKDGRIVARGASDDKGQIYAHVKGAEALLKVEGAPMNLKFIIEGEEEIGSPSLDAFIEAHKDLLAADVVLISDGTMLAPGAPSITYGLKGLAYLEVTVRGAAMDLHSGGFGGGAPNPINGLATMIAKLKDEDNRITVPGFYDDVREIDDTEREAMKRVPFDEKKFASAIGASATPGEAGYTLLERLWVRPTLDANGIGGGFQGEGAKTVIAAEVKAKISCRLVPDQDPADISRKLASYLKEIAPAGLSVEVKELHGGQPALTPLDSPVVQAAARALESVYDKEPVFVRTGGTIPVVASFQKLLGADVVLIGLGFDDDRIH